MKVKDKIKKSKTMDSSSDEEDDKFKDAIDPSFISDDMFQKVLPSSQPQSSKTKTHNPRDQPKGLPRSLRVEKEEPANDMRITPECQRFIAKKLSKLLDSQLSESLVDKRDKKKEKKHRKNSIQDTDCDTTLLSSSKFRLNEPEEVPIVSQPAGRKISIKRRIIDESECTDMEKAKACAVSPEYVLSKKETESWSKRCKREPFVYKKIKGTLTLVEKNEWSNE